MSQDPITSRADLEQHLADMKAALLDDEHKAMTPGAAATSRMVGAVFPEFLRAFDDECRGRQIAPADMLLATEILVVNILEYVASATAEDGRQMEIAEHMLAVVLRHLRCAIDGKESGNLEFVKIPRSRAS